MQDIRKIVLAAALGAAGLLAASAASAHHSQAMFDAGRELKLEGTVKAFEWMSPHCWIQLLVADAAQPDGAAVEWGIEMDNPLGLSRLGWKPGSLKPGDRIVVVTNPLRNGSNGGRVVSVTTADGTPIGRTPAQPQ